MEENPGKLEVFYELNFIIIKSDFFNALKGQCFLQFLHRVDRKKLVTD
jgi:hypothetical protein